MTQPCPPWMGQVTWRYGLTRASTAAIATSGLVLVVTTPTLAWAGPIKFISQARWVEATGYEPYGKETEVAIPFEPFNASVEAGGSFIAKAKQTSTISETAIRASGSSEGHHVLNGLSSLGVSSVKITFALDEATAFYLHGKLETPGNGSAIVKLDGPGISWYHTQGEHNLKDGRNAMLPAGPYTFVVEAMNYASTAWMPTSLGTYDITFETICMADYDGSGSLDIDDFVRFQTLFATGTLLADCDGDGSLWVADFICFQTAFAIGC